MDELRPMATSGRNQRSESVTTDWLPVRNAARYRALGLIANPFAINTDYNEPAGVQAEVAAAGNRLLNAIDAAANEEAPRPIWVSKSDAIPDYYNLRAVSETESSLANDDSLGLLYTYVQLYMLRMGRVRATLNMLGERLAFRKWPTTLALYIEKILEEPDAELISFQMLGQENLDAFAARFREDPAAEVLALFGEPELERRPEFADMGDRRLGVIEADVDEVDSSPEIDNTLGVAAGIDAAIADGPDEAEGVAAEIPEDLSPAVVDYIVEYTKVHLSPVIARAVRVYKERGLAAMALEFRVTKAPRKTLAALVRLARVHFRKVIIIYDGFASWPSAPSETRSQTAGSLTEIRWLLERDACIVMMLERGQVPELEEQYASATRLDWDFEGAIELEAKPGVVSAELVDGWLASATLPGSTPFTFADPVLTALGEAAKGDLRQLLYLGHAAIEDAAERGVSQLDDLALKAALSAEIPEVPAL